MKKAEIYAVSSSGDAGYAWKWRCAVDRTQCRDAFLLYYDCVADARNYGYEVELTRAQGLSAPGGLRSRA
jgi:hypothetical protein